MYIFPNCGATDIVFETLIRIAVATAIVWYGSCCALPRGQCLNILLFWRRSTAALVFWVGAYLESSLFFPPPPHPPPSSPSLIGLLTSVDVKQNYSFVYISNRRKAQYLQMESEASYTLFLFSCSCLQAGRPVPETSCTLFLFSCSFPQAGRPVPETDATQH